MAARPASASANRGGVDCWHIRGGKTGESHDEGDNGLHRAKSHPLFLNPATPFLSRGDSRIAFALAESACYDIRITTEKEMRPGGQLLLRAGVGWQPGCIGALTFATAKDSLSGAALHGRSPIVVEDFRARKQMRIPRFLRTHAVRSGVCVAIHGRGAARLAR